MHCEFFHIFKSFGTNKDILIAKPDDGSRIVSLKLQYVQKIESILKEISKFQNLDPALDNDSISRIEAKLKQRLLHLTKDKNIFTLSE